VGINRASTWSRALAPAEVEDLKQPEQPWGCTVILEVRKAPRAVRESNMVVGYMGLGTKDNC
jgi:hypothetical protein